MENGTEIYRRERGGSCVSLTIEADGEANCLCVAAEAGGFRGEGNLFVDGEDIDFYGGELDRMDKALSGACRIKDAESGEYFLEVFFRKDALAVRGVIGDYQNKLQFEFDADQTLLRRLSAVVKKLKK